MTETRLRSLIDFDIVSDPHRSQKAMGRIQDQAVENYRTDFGKANNLARFINQVVRLPYLNLKEIIRCTGASQSTES